MSLSPSRWILLAIVLLMGLSACKSDSPTNIQPAPDPVPDFALLDVNSTSDSYEQMVSPRDHLHQVSAWYFGHST